MSETYQRLDKSFFQELKELGDLINKGNIIHKADRHWQNTRNNPKKGIKRHSSTS